MNTTMKPNVIFFAAFIVFNLIIISCRKHKPDDAEIKIYLTDMPAPYKSVFIDIKSMLITTDNSNNEELVKLSRTGPYDVLKFSNGLDTLLGSIALPSCNIKQIRFILGANNYLVTGENSILLYVPPEIEPGVKFNVNQKIDGGKMYTFYIDFDASRSIIKINDESYKLNPVLRMFSDATGGTIKGIISPKEAKPLIIAMSAIDTIGTIPNDDGYFMIRGVPTGNYNIVFVPQLSGMLVDSLKNVEVNLGEINNIGTILLN